MIFRIIYSATTIVNLTKNIPCNVCDYKVFMAYYLVFR